MNKKNVIIALILITLLGALLRFFNFTQNPISLNTDEVTFGVNAYSILKTARDEWGQFLPLTFRSVGDYKNPVPTYLLVPSIAAFGLNEFGVRFPFTFFGVLAIPIFFLLTFHLTQNKLTALVAAFLGAISPWHIFYSRFGSDQQMAMVIVTLGLLMFLYMLKRGNYIISFLAAFFLVLSMYTYYVERVFVPLLTTLLFFYFFKILKKDKKAVLIFIVTGIVLIIPLFIRSFLGSDLARGNMVFISKDIEFTRYIILDHINPGFSIFGISIEENLALFFLIANRYLSYLQPDFLFFSGLNMTREGSLGLGIMHLFELPWLILGLFVLLRGKENYKGLILGWLALSILPASFTNNEQNPSRTIIALPMVLTILALGFIKSLDLLKKFKSKLKKTVFSLSYGIFILISLISAFLIFSVHLPKDRGEFSFEGNKQAVEYIIAHKNEYREIVFDPFRGIEAPIIYNLPSHYILFFTKYDPATYQREKKDFDGVYGFGKYRVRKIFWPADRSEKGILFIGSPWSLPIKDLKEEEILQKIYLNSGDLAFLIVTPKPD